MAKARRWTAAEAVCFGCFHPAEASSSLGCAQDPASHCCLSVGCKQPQLLAGCGAPRTPPQLFHSSRLISSWCRLWISSCYQRQNRDKKCAAEQSRAKVFLASSPDTRLRLTEPFQGCRDVLTLPFPTPELSTTCLAKLLLTRQLSRQGSSKPRGAGMAQPGWEAMSTGGGQKGTEGSPNLPPGTRTQSSSCVCLPSSAPSAAWLPGPAAAPAACGRWPTSPSAGPWPRCASPCCVPGPAGSQ